MLPFDIVVPSMLKGEKNHGACDMSRYWWCVGISILGVLLPTSFGLTAKATEPETLNSHSLPISRILVAQDYGFPGASNPQEILYEYETRGDKANQAGAQAYRYGQYEQAFNYFHQAADNYWICLQVKQISGEDRARVQQKYNGAVALRDQANKRRV